VKQKNEMIVENDIILEYSRWEKMKQFYSKYLMPRLLDWVCGMKAFDKLRKKTVPLAVGKVLEVGLGTGQNVAHYHPGQVELVQAIDPAEELFELARQRIESQAIEIVYTPASAEKLPFEDASFDTVLITFTLCTIPDVEKALSEMRRVLKPNGSLIFCEHGFAPEAGVQRWQDRLTPLWKKVAGGCHLNRPITELIQNAGFEISELDAGYHLDGPKPFTYIFRGIARPIVTG